MTLFSPSRILSLEWLGLSVMLVLSAAPVRGAEMVPTDAGLVISLSGEVTYDDESDQEGPSQAKMFMKIRKGDRFILGPGATVRFVYFLGERQETWTGPVTLRVGDTMSQPIGEEGSHAQLTIITLPIGATQGVRRIPDLLRKAGLARPGVTQIRGEVQETATVMDLTEDERADIADARETYRSMQKSVASRDITPELYLIGMLADYEQYEDMETIIDTALQKDPGNTCLRELKEWAHSQASW